MNTPNKKQQRTRRHARIRTKIAGTAARPRLSIFKSNTTLYAQLIDDVSGKTIASISTKGLKGKTGIERSKEAGMMIAEKAKTLKVAKAVFDRGGFIYTGNVKAFADGAREGGLTF